VGESLDFPTIRPVATWTLSPDQVAAWSAAYPHIDVPGECRRALVWVRANKPKTQRGMARFLVGWLNRSATTPSGRPRAISPGRVPHYTEWRCPHEGALHRGRRLPECRTRASCADSTFLQRPERQT